MATNKIASALKAIEDREGRLTPAAVLDVARDKASVLHSEFEWNDGVAAEQWRLEQARRLIRSVTVNVTVNRISTPVPCYVRDPERDGKLQGYRAVVNLARETDEARESVVAEFSRAAGHLRRARDVATALGFDAEIEELIRDIVELDQRVKSGKSKDKSGNRPAAN